MIKSCSKFIAIFLLLSFFVTSILNAQIKSFIIVKVGESLITSIDIQNEIITNLILNKLEINQTNINKSKNYAVKKLINKTIKRNEINKYKIKDYNKQDLEKYINNISKNFQTNSDGLKQIFKKNNINYSAFVENFKTELLWNSLIYALYKNQINVNIIEVDNDVEKLKKNKTEEEIKKIRQNILNSKKEAKLNLFSRSHLSKLENTTNINFNE